MRGMRALLALVAFGLACSGDAPPPMPPPAAPADAGPVSIELGTGTASFRSIPFDGAELELIHGPQGGYHIDVAVRWSGLHPEGLRLRYETRRASDDERLALAEFLLHPGLVARDGAGWLRTGDRTVFDTMDPRPFVDLDVRVLVRATDARGVIAEDMRAVRVVDREP